jgi:hypothetical protein
MNKQLLALVILQFQVVQDVLLLEAIIQKQAALTL